MLLRPSRLSPSFVLAALALFFALGGSAFALRQTTPKPVRCAVGTVRAIAYVTGIPQQGIANLPNAWSSAPALFGYRWSCSGAPIQVRKSTGPNGGFDIRFLNNPGRYPVATAATNDTRAISISPNADGSFQVTEAGGAPFKSYSFRPDSPFFIVLF
jgi:hypothetical protein